MMSLCWKYWPALVVPLPTLIAPLHDNRFTNKLAHNVLNNIVRNSSFYSFALFLIVSLMPFMK